MKELERVRKLLQRVQVSIFGFDLKLMVEHDMESEGLLHEPRVFIQYMYEAPDTKTGEMNTWKGGKWYLSRHMTDDEIIKKAYLAFRTCIEHEVLESFKVDGVILFNPHVNFEELLKISHKEIKRT